MVANKGQIDDFGLDRFKDFPLAGTGRTLLQTRSLSPRILLLLRHVRKDFRQNRPPEKEEARRVEREPASECFIISDAALPEVPSKVSGRRGPRLDTLNPLVTTWSEATLHFLASYFRPQTRAPA